MDLENEKSNKTPETLVFHVYINILLHSPPRKLAYANAFFFI